MVGASGRPRMVPIYSVHARTDVCIQRCLELSQFDVGVTVVQDVSIIDADTDHDYVQLGAPQRYNPQLVAAACKLNKIKDCSRATESSYRKGGPAAGHIQGSCR